MISRESVVGVYPVQCLGEIVDFLDSKRKPIKESERNSGIYPYYGANGQQGTIDNYIFDEPLVLLAEDGGFFDNPERGIAYRISGRTWVNNHAHVLKPRKNLDINYLCRALENYDVTPYVTGTTRGKLTKGGASEILIPLPPIATQKKIAAILDQAEALRSLRRQSIEQLDALARSVFLEMFGDPAKNPKGWDRANLGDLIYSAKDGPHVSPSYVDNGGVPFLSTRHVRHGEIIWEDLKFISTEDALIYWKRGKPERGDILYTKGGTTGIAKVIDFEREFAFWVHVALLKPKREKVNSTWLENMLNSDFCYQQSQYFTHGIANRDLGLQRMVKIKMYLPPLPLQQQFADRIQAIETLKTQHRQSLATMDTLFNSLQHRAFRGEL